MNHSIVERRVKRRPECRASSRDLVTCPLFVPTPCVTHGGIMSWSPGARSRARVARRRGAGTDRAEHRCREPTRDGCGTSRRLGRCDRGGRRPERRVLAGVRRVAQERASLLAVQGLRGHEYGWPHRRAGHRHRSVRRHRALLSCLQSASAEPQPLRVSGRRGERPDRGRRRGRVEGRRAKPSTTPSRSSAKAH